MSDDIALQKYARLVEGLYTKTVENSLEWKPSDFVDGYECRLAGRIVSLTKIPRLQGSAPDYEVKLMKSEDYSLMDSFKDPQLLDLGNPNVGSFDTYYQLMKSMYETITRRLSGADAALDEILGELES